MCRLQLEAKNIKQPMDRVDYVIILLHCSDLAPAFNSTHPLRATLNLPFEHAFALYLERDG